MKNLLKNKIISSTLIRKLLSNGKIEFVNKLLNRNWSIYGKVEKGRQLGKKIGFPTCNIDIKDYILAKPGVYAVKIYQKRLLKENTIKTFNAGCNIVLHCNAKYKEMLTVAKNSPKVDSFIMKKTEQFYKMLD